MASFLFDIPYSKSENTPEPNMTTSRKELVRKIKKKNDESDERDKRNNGSWHYYLEINEICGISVDVELVRNHNGLSVLITPFNVWLYDKKKLIDILQKRVNTLKSSNEITSSYLKNMKFTRSYLNIQKLSVRFA